MLEVQNAFGFFGGVGLAINRGNRMQFTLNGNAAIDWWFHTLEVRFAVPLDCDLTQNKQAEGKAELRIIKKMQLAVSLSVSIRVGLGIGAKILCGCIHEISHKKLHWCKCLPRSQSNLISNSVPLRFLKVLSEDWATSSLNFQFSPNPR